MAHILAVDNSNVTRSLIQLTLETLDFVKVDTADCVAQGIAMCGQKHYDILILGYLMSDGTGLDMIDLLRQQHLQSNTPIFIISSETDESSKALAQVKKVKAWLKKPFHPRTLIELITDTLKKGESPHNQIN